MTEVIKFLTLNHYTDVKEDVDLKKYTTFKVGGKVALLVTPENKTKLIDLILFLKENNVPFKVLGNGSNILPSDNYYNGVIIKTNKALNYLEVNDTLLTVGAGYPLIKLANDMVRYELTGLEFLGGIPGSIGGAVFMNAGAYKREMCDVIKTVTIMNKDGQFVTLNNEDLQYGYRRSVFQKDRPLIIIETTLELEHGNKDEIINLLEQRKERRRDTQPLEYPSGGSTFRNPTDTHAYLLIDEANLRGYTIGGAKVSEKHCNFIINYHNATATDIKNLIDYIIESVYLKTGTTLVPEVEFFNW